MSRCIYNDAKPLKRFFAGKFLRYVFSQRKDKKKVLLLLRGNRYSQYKCVKV